MRSSQHSSSSFAQIEIQSILAARKSRPELEMTLPENLETIPTAFHVSLPIQIVSLRQSAQILARPRRIYESLDEDAAPLHRHLDHFLPPNLLPRRGEHRTPDEIRRAASTQLRRTLDHRLLIRRDPQLQPTTPRHASHALRLLRHFRLLRYSLLYGAWPYKTIMVGFESDRIRRRPVFRRLRDPPLQAPNSLSPEAPRRSKDFGPALRLRRPPPPSEHASSGR